MERLIRAAGYEPKQRTNLYERFVTREETAELARQIPPRPDPRKSAARFAARRRRLNAARPSATTPGNRRIDAQVPEVARYLARHLSWAPCWSWSRSWSSSADGSFGDPRTVAVEPVAVPGDPAAVERGAHLARTRCVFCHGDDLGGKKFIDDASFMLLNAPNLTRGPGGVGASYVDDAAWVRAIRHGVNPQGRALIIMPAEVYYFLSDGDLGDLIAYLKSVPPVDRSWAAPRPGLVAKALFGAGKLDNMLAYLTTDHKAPRPAKPEAGATAEYGEYIVRTFGCRNCHGPSSRGSRTPAIRRWSRRTSLRAARSPTGARTISAP